MNKIFMRIGIINFSIISILLFIFLILQKPGTVTRNTPMVIFFINLFSFTIISIVILNTYIRKKLNYKINKSNNIIFKAIKLVSILTTILILILTLGIEFIIFAFGVSSSEYTMNINNKLIIGRYESFSDDPEFYYPINLFFMKPANLSSNEYIELRNKFDEVYNY